MIFFLQYLYNEGDQTQATLLSLLFINHQIGISTKVLENNKVMTFAEIGQHTYQYVCDLLLH